MLRCASCGELTEVSGSPALELSCQSCGASGGRYRGGDASFTLSEHGSDGLSDEEWLGWPETLGRYRLGDLIGRGGMGWVFRAHDETLQTDVALKVLPPASAMRGSRRARFEREARALAGLRHPRLLDIRDVGEQDGFLYIALELMRGTLLGRGLDPAEATRADVERVCQWMLQAAEGVAALHECGTVHRDIKPSNLLLDESGDVKVGDFGLAWVEGEVELTRTGVGIGSALYSAPEQLRGREATKRSDVYALGATLHALLANEAPDAAGRLGVLPRSLPAGLRSLLERSLSSAEEFRPADAAEWLREFARIVDPARRRRRAVAGVLALVVVAAIASQVPAWLSRGPARTLKQAIVLQPLDILAEYPPRRRGLQAVGLQVPATSADWPRHERLPFRPGGLELELVAPSAEDPRTLRIERGDRLFAEVPLPWPDSEGEGWALVTSEADLNGDGVADPLVSDGAKQAIVAIDPLSYGVAELGWRNELVSGFGNGSVALSDVDGDGSLEGLVGDPGEYDDAGNQERKSGLLVVDLEDGTLLQRLPFDVDQHTNSTPVVLHDAEGQADVVLLDTQNPKNRLRVAELFAWDAGSDGPARRVTALESAPGRLTWTVPVDLDGDGAEDGIVARFGLTEGGSLQGFDPRGESRLLWERRLLGDAAVTPTFSQQDEDPELEVCVLTRVEMTCFDLDALANGGDPIWAQDVANPSTAFNGLVRIPDIDGDGAEELAVGGMPGLWLFSAALPEPLGLQASPEAMTTTSGPSAFFARPVLLPRAANGSVRIAAVASNETFACWEIRADGATLLWERVGHTTARSVQQNATATPQLVRYGDDDRWGLLLRQPLSVLDLGSDDPGATLPEVIWEPWSGHPVADYKVTGFGTPRVGRIGDRDWVILTAPKGAVEGLPLPFPMRVAPSDAWDER